MGKSYATFENVKLFNVKSVGKATRFGIGINGKKQDGTYTKNAFLNCVCFESVSAGQLYTISGYFSASEYQDKVTLEFIVQTAVPQGIPQSKPRNDDYPAQQIPGVSNPPSMNRQIDDIDQDSIPF